MQQQIAVITLGVADVARSRRFYVVGFGWTPAFDNGEIVFYQMNGFVLATWIRSGLADDMMVPELKTPGSFALAHNVRDRAEVRSTMDRLVQYGGRLLRGADEPPHGGYRGYVADPDDHAWEIAWNPAWPIADDGTVSFSL